MLLLRGLFLKRCKLKIRDQWVSVTVGPCHSGSLSQLVPVTVGLCHSWSLSQWVSVTVDPCHSWSLSQLVSVTVGPCHSWSLSSWHGASSGCGWRNGLQLWRVAANILNKQSRTADREWSSSLGLGRGANNSPPQKINHVTKYRKKHWNQTNPSVGHKQWKRDMRIGNGREERWVQVFSEETWGKEKTWKTQA
jgi:hypothetical protein